MFSYPHTQSVIAHCHVVALVAVILLAARDAHVASTPTEEELVPPTRLQTLLKVSPGIAAESRRCVFGAADGQIGTVPI